MTSQVDEFLKTCRFHYRTLVVVCVTSLVFAVAPSEKQMLQEAIQEAELVAEMDFGRLLDQAVMDDPGAAGTYMRKITGILSRRVISYAGPVHGAVFPHGQLRLPDQSFTIDRIQAYIQDKQSVTFDVPQLDEGVFEEIRDHLLKGVSHSIRFGSIEYPVRNDQSYQVAIRPELGTQTKFEIDSPWKGLQQTEVQADLVRLIREDPEYQVLVHCPGDDTVVIFPRLHRFWEEIRDMKPRRAVSYLAYRNANVSDNVALLGLSIPAYLAGLAVPLASFILILHLHLYVRKLAQLPEQNGEAQAEELLFPWIPLFRDRLSRLLTLASYPILPIVANVLILRRSFHLGVVWTMVLTIILIALLGFYSCPRLTGRLRRLSNANLQSR